MRQDVVLPQGVLFAQDFTGPHSLGTVVSRDGPVPCTGWCQAYNELFRPVNFGAGTTVTYAACFNTSTSSLEFITEALPILRPVVPSEALTSIRIIERVFGESASHLSKMLRVSRQMIYHYRDGMEPSVENFRRIKLISDLAGHVPPETGISLEPVLKLPQPEGQSLLTLLSQESPNIPIVRRIVLRASADLQKRTALAAIVGYATAHDRQDIMRARHLAGKPIYVSDPDIPGKIVQIRPDRSRVRGRMVNRVFVPDEE